MIRYQQPVFGQIRAELDPTAVCGKDIKLLALEPNLFKAQPEAHPTEVCSALRVLYDTLEQAANNDGRLASGSPLIRGWTLSYDIYSPKLARFIEVDECQHFSRPRLKRIWEACSSGQPPLYPAHFWNAVFERLMKKPFRDLDPPHRDEQRAFRDEAREILPRAYGLAATIRLDEYSLRETGSTAVDMIQQLLASEAS
jgi:hypothetical protein